MTKGRFSVIVDTETCIACGLCVELAPKIFESFDSDGQPKSRVRVDAVIDDLETLIKAAQSCAVGAITVIDNATGEKLWPKQS